MGTELGTHINMPIHTYRVSETLNILQGLRMDVVGILKVEPVCTNAEQCLD